jgi:hypothetical protein
LPPNIFSGPQPVQIEKLIEQDIEILAMWRDAAVAKPGDNQFTVHDNIMHRKANGGTSRLYAASRLRRAAPEPYEEVKEGRLSANAAPI